MSSHQKVVFFITLWAISLSVACQKTSPDTTMAAMTTPAPSANNQTEPLLAKKPEATIQITPEHRKEALAIFQQRCVLCHGPEGKGDGPAAAALSPKPQSYTDATWSRNISDVEIYKAIVGGGQAVGKSMMMPANPDLKDKPEIVHALVEHVRKLSHAP